MNPLALLLIGVTIVIGGVLALRMHAFLALTLAALTVGALTAPTARFRYLASQEKVECRVTGESFHLKTKLAGRRFVVARVEEGQLAKVGELATADQPSGEAGWVAATPVGAGPLGWAAGDLVIAASDWEAAVKESRVNLGERLGRAFGEMCGKIGLLIAMAAIIGKCLLDSGAADRIVRAALSLVGERGAPLAFMGSGFLLGIPVFFDTVFYLMIPLGKAMRVRTGRHYLLYVLTIVCGATMAHSLVPPTPGPLAVAELLGVDLGIMIVAGGLVGLATASAGFVYAVLVSRHHEVPLRESADFSLQQLEEIVARPTTDLPPLTLSLLPIVLPVLLIAGHTAVESLEERLGWSPATMDALATLGNKNIALMLAAAVAVLTLIWIKRPRLADLKDSLSGALASGGVIILITAAGGAFGAMLQQTGIVAVIERLPHGSTAAVLTMAFFITTAIRTAQGSATVAMITAVGVLAGFADPATLGCHPVYLALAIGCGSKPVAWMNDSGFWVICKMSGMTEGEGLRYITPMSILMGFVGLAVVLLGATLFPMA